MSNIHVSLFNDFCDIYHNMPQAPFHLPLQELVPAQAGIWASGRWGMSVFDLQQVKAEVFQILLELFTTF